MITLYSNYVTIRFRSRFARDAYYEEVERIEFTPYAIFIYRLHDVRVLNLKDILTVILNDDEYYNF